MLRASSLLAFVICFSCSGTYPAFAVSQSRSPELVQAASSALDFPSDLCVLQVSHSSVVQTYAFLDWQCGEATGELLLERQGDFWQTLAKGGGAYSSTQLVEYGVPEDIAVQLVREVQLQWERVGDETL